MKIYMVQADGYSDRYIAAIFTSNKPRVRKGGTE